MDGIYEMGDTPVTYVDDMGAKYGRMLMYHMIADAHEELMVLWMSCRLMKWIPRALNSSRLSIKCFKERAKRSNFQTRTTSNIRLRASLIKASSWGRWRCVPLTPASVYS
jgi:hypothetical protein